MIRVCFYLIILFTIGSGSFSASGQSIRPIPLNKHYFEIPEEDSLNQAFYKLVSFTADSTKIERVFTRNNQINRITRTSPLVDEYQEQTIEQFDADGQLKSKTTANLANSKFITSYFTNGEQVAQVMYRGEHKYSIFRPGYESPRQTLENDFEPRPNEKKSDFGFFLRERTKFSKNEWPSIRHHVVIGVLVDESGTVKEVVWANPLGAEKRVADKFLKALQAWKKGFLPAMDEWGNPVEAWTYYHYRAGGRIENAQLIINFNRP